MAEEQRRWGYEIGPSDEMKKEIGQIVVNHAFCETVLKGLLVAVARWEDKDAQIILKTFNPKGDPICKALEKFLLINAAIDELVRERIGVVITNFRRLSQLRNMVAHWVWSPTRPDSPQAAIVSNHPYGLAPGEQRNFTLMELKEIGLGLAEIVAASFVLMDFANDPRRAPIEFQEKLDQFDSIMEKVKQAVLDLPPASEDEEQT